ncbi:hypothetical protein DPMN_127694 [Dreissena polymorpha]|uniref:Uncharacterized protein n=1 Tax=Dreissena polymorpha TaxID=45954 RepID=A0A9D4GY33_DREPO|nr:hypothetical protein DPMN_127694 [Dreissena polymorpha]
MPPTKFLEASRIWAGLAQLLVICINVSEILGSRPPYYLFNCGLQMRDCLAILDAVVCKGFFCNRLLLES